MFSESRRRRALLISGVVGVLLILFIFPASPLSITTVDRTPSELSVSSLERLETGCAEDITTYEASEKGNGSYTRVSFIETGTETANLSAWTERTSHSKAALETFRVYIEATEQPQQETECRMGVQYRLEMTFEEGSSGGFLSGDEGHRIVYLENGEYNGCSSSTSGSLDAECYRFAENTDSDRTWANITKTG